MAEPVLRAVKRLVGVGRVPGPVEEARDRHSAARAEVDRIETEQAGKVREVRATFEASGSEADADRLATVERRAQIMVDAARLKMSRAFGELERLEAEAKEARIADLEAIVNSTSARTSELASKALPHFRALLEIVAERDGILAASTMAARELGALRGEPVERTHAREAGIASARAVLRAKLGELVVYDDRERVISLLDSGPFGPGPGVFAA